MQVNEMARVMEHTSPEEKQVKTRQKAFTAQEANLAEYLGARPEIGITKMLLNLGLEPQDPFKPEEGRRARKGLVVAALFFVALFAWFVWFSVIR
jgi:hypothetical protein